MKIDQLLKFPMYISTFTCLSLRPSSSTSSINVNFGVVLLSSISRGSYAIFFSVDGEGVLGDLFVLECPMPSSSELCEEPATRLRVMVDMVYSGSKNC